ncbi:MAG: hypothetical protein ABIK73_06880 [candidate division WOR-3 bacterium]
MKRYKYHKIQTTAPIDLITMFPEANYSTLAKDLVMLLLSYARAREDLVDNNIVDKLVEYNKIVSGHFSNLLLVSNYLKYKHGISCSLEQVLVNSIYALMKVYGGMVDE